MIVVRAGQLVAVAMASSLMASSRAYGQPAVRAYGRAAAPVSPAAHSTVAPPRLLNIVLVKLKHGTAASYTAIQAAIARATARAKVGVYWLGLQGSKGADEVLYLDLHESQESADRAAAALREAVKQHPDLSRLQQQLAELTASQTSLLTTRRDDVDPPVGRPDFATMRAVRVTIFEVKPGREGDFITAIRTTKAKDRVWLVYEANDSSTFVLVTPMLTVRSERHDGPPIPRGLHRFKGVYTKVDTRTYGVRPTMSHVPQTFATANPQLWRPVAAGTH